MTRREQAVWYERAAKRWCAYAAVAKDTGSKNAHLEIAQWMHDTAARLRRALADE